MSLPFSLIAGPNNQFTDDNGDPIAGGFIQTLESGTATLKDTYSSPDTVSPTVNQNPCPMDSSGRVLMYGESGSYDLEIMDANSVVLYTITWQDVGLTFLSTLGVQLAEGSRDVVSGYQLLSTDNTITVDSTGGANPCVINLEAVADRGQDLVIQNLGTVPLAITPNGAETINAVAAAYAVTASASPRLSTVTLRPDGSSNWLVIGEVVA